MILKYLRTTENSLVLKVAWLQGTLLLAYFGSKGRQISMDMDRNVFSVHCTGWKTCMIQAMRKSEWNKLKGASCK